MTNKIKRLFAVFILFLSINLSLYSQSDNQKTTASASDAGSVAFLEGCVAYSKGEWETAVFSLRKSIAYSETANPDAYYMLISSELNNFEYSNALDDCDTFTSLFPSSVYSSRIQYYKGRTLYNLGDYERAIIVLSDFCHQYQGDDMYPYSLFYIGESLFAAYKYDEAASIYERLVTEYPDSEKASASQYRLESITQRSREEKLLYLLKQTGEEYLSAKEEYEKQLRTYNSDTVLSARQKLTDAQLKNEELENQIRDLETQISILRNEVNVAQEARKAEAEKNQKLAEELATRNVETPVVNNSETVKLEEEKPVEPPKNKSVRNERKEQLELLRLKALEAQRRYEEQQNENEIKNSVN